MSVRDRQTVCVVLLRRGCGPTRLTQLRDGGEKRGGTDLREGALGKDTAEALLVTVRHGQGAHVRDGQVH
jgi:hypothetical protein